MRIGLGETAYTDITPQFREIVFSRGLQNKQDFFRKISNGAGPSLIQAFINPDNFPVTRLTAMVVIIHYMSK